MLVILGIEVNAARAQGAAEGLPPPVAVAMAATRTDPNAASFLVLRADSGESVLSVNADLVQNPASLMKLVTTAAALDILGPQFSWTTRLMSAASLHGGVLKGDLYIQAAGDPRFAPEHLWLMLRDARARGVKEVRGDLVVDTRVYANLSQDESKFDAEPHRAYNAAPHALLLNYKATTIRLLPIDGRLAVSIDPLAPDVALKNEVHLADGACGDWKRSLKIEFDSKAVTVSGQYPRTCGARNWYMNVLDHEQYLRQAFLQTWADLGGRVTQGFAVRAGEVPTDARLIAEWNSAPLAEQIRDINKYSNNVMARELFIDIGGIASGQPGSPELAAQVVRAWLDHKGVRVEGLTLENGSGLSRVERIEPRSLGQLLSIMYRGPWMAEYMASLPIAGVDGTLRNRLTGRSAGYAHLKTGTLGDVRDPQTEVRAIAGYVLGNSGRWYVLVSIINGPTAANAQPAQDALVQWVIENG
jgi:D-alanyl-D-alanine carboxypeptidase/D-alanyl-D-alanine-endopeptidase (penicillin-binding protein 4)